MTDETDIRPLDEDTVARIAAGEVVERPASAVKELVENSLDAGASRIDVTVEEGGRELIRVADDGRGMTEADLRAAVRQHTTSKIRDLEDLERGVATLGFRGEALHTIGSVSKLRIRSRPRPSAVADRDGDGADGAGSVDPTGTELVYEGGEVTSVEPTGCPEGTIVEVSDLFYNTPARRKFLKTTATEFAHVNRVVTRYALANPDVAISLEHDGREVFATTGQGDLQAAVLSVYGREVARSMIPVEAGDAPGEDDATDEDTDATDKDADATDEAADATDGDADATDGGPDSAALPPGPVDSISGLISHPETNRSSPEYLSTYVNGRAVTADAIREGIMGAYGGQLGGDRYPFAVLFLDVPGEAVDVNVHPRKREVRFDDDDAVRRQVDAAVEAALLDHGLLRSRAPRGRSAPDEARIEPGGTRESGPSDGSDPDRASADTAVDGADAGTAGRRSTAAESGADPPTSERSTAGRAPGDAPNPEAGDPEPREATSPADAGRDGSKANGASASTDDRVRSSTQEPTDGAASGAESASTDDSTEGPGASGAARTPGVGDSETRSDGATKRADDAGTGRDRVRERDRKFGAAGEQRTLGGERATADVEFDSLPPLRVLGQLRDTYVVCESPDGLVLIDQHAADERVNYERLQRAFERDATAQALAEPVELELTAAEAEAFGHYREALERLGFYADRTGGDRGEADDEIDGSNRDAVAGSGGRTVTVTTVPAILDETLDPDRLRDVLASFVAGDREAGSETVDALADDFLADLACYPSITGNTSLTEGSVVDLLSTLDDCENPYACPHGRPVIVQFDAGEIEDRFERDYPGHGG